MQMQPKNAKREEKKRLLKVQSVNRHLILRLLISQLLLRPSVGCHVWLLAPSVLVRVRQHLLLLLLLILNRWQTVVLLTLMRHGILGHDTCTILVPPPDRLIMQMARGQRV